MKITSRDNQRLKNARKIRDGKISGLIFVEGIRLVEEILRSNVQVKEIFYSENLIKNSRGIELLERFSVQNVEIFEVSELIFNSLSDTKNSQGIALIAEKPRTGKYLIESNLTKQFPLILLLHEINNPNNLGAILRTAEAAGVSAIILTKNSTNAFSPKAIRASMGACFRAPIWENADFDEVLNWGKENNFSTVCADVNEQKNYLEIEWKKPRILVLGSEAHGLSLIERDKIGEGFIIPMANKVESLNLAVACGIVLFEAKRQKEM